MIDNATFGRLLRQRRKQLDLTQEEVAQAALCAAETVRKLESGTRRASKVVAHNLADALRLTGNERAEFLRLARLAPAAAAAVQADRAGQPVPNHEVAPLLATKFYLPRPRLQRVVRPRLLARLEVGLAGPLTLIAAPAGFGKTTLLADLLHQPTTSRPTAWLSLDAGDSDPIQFLRYLITALQTLHPAIGATVLPLLRSTQLPLEPLLPVLVNDLTHAPEGSLLVLDDYHAIDSPAIHQMLTFLLDHLPPQLHLVIASRVDPPVPLARLRARGQLVEIRATDLRFTIEEAAAFLHEVMGLHLSAADVAAIEARTEGWITGLQLAALSLQDLSSERVSAFLGSFTGSHRFVVDYLMDEVLASQPSHVQTFLRQSSILDRLCGSLCDAVMGAASATSQQLLEQLERANLFLVPLDEERRWYRYHHLFAQVLNARLLDSASQAEVATLHRRAAAWFAQQGFVAEAIQHEMAAQEWEGAAILMESNSWRLLVQGHANRVRSWLKTFPTDLLQTRPFLLDLQAALFFSANELEAAERAIQMAEAAVAESGQNERSHTILGYAAMMRANIARAHGDIVGCTEYSRQAIAILPSQEVVRRSVAMLGMALIFRATGDLGPTNEQGVIHAIAATRRVGNVLSLFNALVAMAEFQGMQGQLHKAAATYHEASEIAAQLLDLKALTNGAGYYGGLGAILYEWNDLETAGQTLRQGQELIRRGLQTHGDVVTNGYITLARLQQARGNGEDALATLHELRHLAQERNFAPYLADRAKAAIAQLALRQNDLSSALRWAHANEWLPEGEADYLREQEWLTLVRVRLASSRQSASACSLSESLHLLERLLFAAQRYGRVDSVIHILMLRALVIQAQGDLRAALESLGDALQLAMPAGYLRLFVDEGTPLAQLLAQGLAAAFAAPSVRSYAEQLLQLMQPDHIHPAAQEVKPAFPTPSPIPGGESLTAREMEVLRLLAAGASNQAIALQLVVELGTVKRHVSNIMDKLQAQSRLEAVARARDLALI